MSLEFPALARFAIVIAGAGAICFVSSQFMLTSLSNAIAAAPPVQHNIRQTYVPHLPKVEASALNIASSVDVRHEAAAPTPTGSVPVAANGDMYSVAVESLRVRSGPSKTMPQVLTIKGGRLVEVTDSIKGWFKITDEDGNTGWAYGSLLNPVQSVAAQ